MREAGDRKQRDDRAVVRQRIHAAARHRGDAVQHLERNVRPPSAAAMNVVRHGRERDAHAARCRTGDAGERGDRDRLVDQRVGDGAAAPRRSGGSRAARRSRAPKPYSEAVFIDASKAPADRGLACLRRISRATGPPGEQQDGEDAEQQRAFNGPDRGDRADLRDDRLAVRASVESCSSSRRTAGSSR